MRQSIRLLAAAWQRRTIQETGRRFLAVVGRHLLPEFCIILGSGHGCLVSVVFLAAERTVCLHLYAFSFQRLAMLEGISARTDVC